MNAAFHWESAVATHVGNRRSVNEDAVLERPDLGLWVVADGMGGHFQGGVASKAVVEALNRVAAHQDLAEFVNDVEDRLIAVHRQLRETAIGFSQSAIIGTTVVTVLMHKCHYLCLWAGDSRLYCLRGGSLTQCNEDHSRIQELLAAGLIDEAEAENRPDSNVITRAVGVYDELFLDADVGELRDGDRFLLCSDGLYRELGDSFVAHEMASGSPKIVCDKLMEDVLQTDARDNVSIAVIDVSKAPRES